MRLNTRTSTKIFVLIDNTCWFYMLSSIGHDRLNKLLYLGIHSNNILNVKILTLMQLRSNNISTYNACI